MKTRDTIEEAIDSRKEIGRIAFRHEGQWYKAYWALPDTMKGSILVATIAFVFVESKERQEAFMDVVRQSIADLLEHRTGARPSWSTRTAPEGERSGHA